MKLIHFASAILSAFTLVRPLTSSVQTVEMGADLGFFAFSYGGSNTFAFQNFVLVLDRPALLTVTDCFCPGDTFQVFDYGAPVMVTDECGFTIPTDCSVGYNPNAWSCMNSDDFCHGKGLLNSGRHNLTIAVRNSELGGGAAFLRIDTICPDPIGGPDNVLALCCLLKDPSGIFCNQMAHYPPQPTC